MMLWLSPCWLPLAAVALLAIFAVLRQARHDSQARRSKPPLKPDAEADPTPPAQP